MKVPIYKLNFDNKYRKKFFNGCQTIFDSGVLTNGSFLRQFEKKFANLCGTKYALGVNSGTGALEVVLRALDIRGKKIILPANTFIATAAAVKNAGGEILLLDIEDETFSLAPAALKEALAKEQNISAVIIVHIAGIISRHIETIASLCKKYKVPLIEDAAHAQGSVYKGKEAGSLGLAGAFSFFPTKVMTTAEGGMITTNSSRLHGLMYSIRQFGMNPKAKDLHIRSGSNFKMTEFAALLGLLELKRVDERLARRNKLAHIYQSQLRNSPWQVITPSPQQGKSSYYKQIVLSPVSLQRAQAFCKKKGIELTGTVYRYPLHHQPVFKQQFKSKKFPIADKFCKKHICPPLYPELSEEQVKYVCQTLLKLKKI